MSDRPIRLAPRIWGFDLVNALRCRYLALHYCQSVFTVVEPGFSGWICPARFEIFNRLGELSALVASAECPGATLLPPSR